MKRHLFLIFWTVGMLLPMAWFVQVSPAAYRLFNTLFSPAWMHIVMHILLYAVLGVLLMQRLPGNACQARRLHSGPRARCRHPSGGYSAAQQAERTPPRQPL